MELGSLESRSIYSAISVRIKSNVLVSLAVCITTYSLYHTHSLFQKGSACKSQELMPHVQICMIQLPNKHNSAINGIIENLLLQMYVYIAN